MGGGCFCLFCVLSVHYFRGARTAEKLGVLFVAWWLARGCCCHNQSITAAKMTKAGWAGIAARGGWAGLKLKQSPKFWSGPFLHFQLRAAAMHTQQRSEKGWWWHRRIQTAGFNFTTVYLVYFSLSYFLFPSSFLPLLLLYRFVKTSHNRPSPIYLSTRVVEITSHMNQLKLGTRYSIKLTNTREIYNIRDWDSLYIISYYFFLLFV
jgi:hypothetical protein